MPAILNEYTFYRYGCSRGAWVAELLRYRIQDSQKIHFSSYEKFSFAQAFQNLCKINTRENLCRSLWLLLHLYNIFPGVKRGKTSLFSCCIRRAHFAFHVSRSIYLLKPNIMFYNRSKKRHLTCWKKTFFCLNTVNVVPVVF